MWLIKGLFITAKRFFSRKITQSYPEVYPDLPKATRGDFQFSIDKCTACTLCALACPNKVIQISTDKTAEGKRRIDQYQMSLGYCLYCGLCVEACPTLAIEMKPSFTPAYYKKNTSLLCWTYKEPTV